MIRRCFRYKSKPEPVFVKGFLNGTFVTDFQAGAVEGNGKLSGLPSDSSTPAPGRRRR